MVPDVWDYESDARVASERDSKFRQGNGGPTTLSADTGPDMHRYLHGYVRRLRVLAWNEREQRRRALLRVNVFLLVYVRILLSLPALVLPVGDSLLRSAVLRMLLVCCTVGLLLAAARWLDSRPVHTFGLEIDRRWVSGAPVGTIIGGAILTVARALGVMGGWITVGRPGASPPPTTSGGSG